MTSLRRRLAGSLNALRAAVRNAAIRRVQLAYAGSSIGSWAGSTALTVYAFEAGGPAAAGLLVVLRMLPAAVAAPVAATLADRLPRVRVMVASDLAAALVTAGIAAMIVAGVDHVVVLAAAGLRQMAITAFEPAKAALLPQLAREPDELTAANVVASSLDSVSIFIGPAIGGLLLAVASPEAAVAVSALALLWSATMVASIHAGAPERRPAEREGGPLRAFVREVADGARAVAGAPPVRLLVGLLSAQAFLDGALGVLLVAAAIDLLDMGEAGLGVLNSAAGVGGILGAIATVSLVGRRRLTPAFALGIVLWGLPIALMGVVPVAVVAVALMAVVGLANTLVDVAGYTLLQRSAPDEVLARVFGVLESAALVSVALGGLVAAALVDGLGIEVALVASGAFLPVLMALRWSALRRVDAVAATAVSPEDLDLLRGVPMFAPLRPSVLEELAAKLQPAAAPAGAEIVRQGEAGDRFYLIAAGEVEVLVDGEAVRREGPGDWFGEIALLRDAPRSATARALGDVELRTLDRDSFLAAVTGHARSAAAADVVVGARLRWARPAAV